MGSWGAELKKRAVCPLGGSGGHPSAIAQGRLSRKARAMAHPQLFRSMSKNRSALYFAVKVAHPPPPVVSVDIKKTNPRSTSPLKCPTRSPHSHGVDQYREVAR